MPRYDKEYSVKGKMYRQEYTRSRSFKGRYIDSNMMNHFDKGIVEMYCTLDENKEYITDIRITIFGYAEGERVENFLILKIKKGKNSYKLKGKRLILESEHRNKKVIIVFSNLSEKHINFLKNKKLKLSEDKTWILINWKLTNENQAIIAWFCIYKKSVNFSSNY